MEGGASIKRLEMAAAARSPQATAGPEALLDARKLTTRQLNSSIRALVAEGRREIVILNPDARHNIVVGVVSECRITFRGSVGYYCCSYCDGIDATIEGNSGWGLGDNLMSGRIVVEGDVGASTGASMRGGALLVYGNAGARAGISMKGGELLVAGNSGFLTGFMMQKGRIVVLGDVGDAAGDSMYEGVIYFGGAVDSLGADAKLQPTSHREDVELKSTLRRVGISEDRLPVKIRKIVSAKKLYHYDSLEPLERERLVI
jgi:methylamine---glutamate N-methyltransferase subunit B